MKCTSCNNVVALADAHDVVYLCLSSSSDDHHMLHSCLGTGMRLERKTSFVIIVHLWFIRCPQSFPVVVGVFSITILPLLVQIVRTFATVTIFVQCVLVNTLQYHDTVDLVQDSETEDPQLVAEPDMGRNPGKTMGKN